MFYLQNNCTATIIAERAMHTRVRAVNILSFKKYHVRIGKVRYDIAKIKNRGPQTCPMSAYAIFIPYQKHMPVGTEKTIAATSGLSFHHSHTN